MLSKHASVVAASAPKARLIPLALAIHLAFAGALALGGHAAAQTQAAAVVQYDIPAGPLAAALNRFAQRSGVAVALDADKVQGLRSEALKGGFGVEEGFNALLRGSAFVIGKTDAGYVLVAAPKGQPTSAAADAASGETVLRTIQVTAAASPDELPAAYAGGHLARGSALGVLGNTDIMDAPFHTTSFTAKLIEDQQASTVAAVLLNDPSIRATTSEGHIYENFSIRGFEISNEDLAFNGMYGVAPQGHVPTEFLERVEVLKGPGALLGGMAPQGSVGAVVNLVPKRAGDEPLRRVAADFSGESQLGVHLDVGQRFGQGQRFGVRVNAAYRDGKVGVDGQNKERSLASVALDYRGEKLRMSLDAYKDGEHITNGSSWMATFAGPGVNAPPKAGTNLLRGIFGKLDTQAALLHADYEFSDSLNAYAGLGAMRYRYAGYINGTRARIKNAAGDYDGQTYNQRGSSDTVSAEVGLRARFSSGPVKHQMTLGANAIRLDGGRATVMNSPLYKSNIYQPVTPLLAATPGAPLQSGDATLSSVALADTLAFAGDKVLLTLGARHQRVQSATFDGKGVKGLEYDKSALTPALGLVLKPWDAPVSLYANAIEGLSQGSKVNDPQSNNNGFEFPPYKAKQVEAGLKWDLGRFAHTVSAFQIKKPGVVYDEQSKLYGIGGGQRNRGLEWSAFGQVGAQLQLQGGLAYTEGKLTFGEGKPNNGNTAFGTPKWKANLGAEWQVAALPALALNARAIYTGAQFVNAKNTQQIGSWTRYDLGARYAARAMGRDVVLRANVENLFDKSYWAGSFNDGFVTQGAARVFKLAAATDF